MEEPLEFSLPFGCIAEEKAGAELPPGIGPYRHFGSRSPEPLSGWEIFNSENYRKATDLPFGVVFVSQITEIDHGQQKQGQPCRIHASPERSYPSDGRSWPCPDQLVLLLQTRRERRSGPSIFDW